MLEFLKLIYWKYYKKNFSQGREQSFILNYFQNQSKGLYIDIGSHHPFRFSNTAALYKKGWSGVNIDPDKTYLDLFNKYRKRDINIQCLVSDSDKNSEYFYISDNALNGILSSERLKTIKRKGYDIIGSEILKPKSLNQIIEEFLPNINKIDFLDIDVEGHELNVLKSINLKKIHIRLILVEINKNEQEIDRYLFSHGYEYLKKEDRNKFYFKN